MKTNAPALSQNPARNTAGRTVGSSLALLLATCLMPWAASAGEYPIMQLTPQDMDEIVASYMSAPMMPDANAAPNFPLAMSLLPYLPYTPTERNQGGCGNCWAWAGTGVMEIAHAVQNGVRDRLSVQLLNSCGTQRACCAGGGLGQVSYFYSTVNRFALPWSNPNASWRSGNGTCAAALCGNIATSPRYDMSSVTMNNISTFGVGPAQAMANIKSVLNQNRAVYFAFGLPDFNPFFTYWGNQPETAVWNSFPMSAPPGTPNPNPGWHAVLCVGYDETDPSNPYWIMVNSWGTAAGRPNGLFRVAMNLDYNASYGGFAQTFWQTLDVRFAGPIAQPEIAVSQGNTIILNGQSAPVSFGAVAVGESASTRTFTVCNIGNAPLSLGAVNAPSGWICTKQLPASLTPGQRDTFTLAMATGTSGTKTGQVSFENNDSDENPFRFPITGRVAVASPLVWVDASSACANPTGSQACPYRSACDGYGVVARGGTVRIRPGTYAMCAPALAKPALLEPSGGAVLLTAPPPDSTSARPFGLGGLRRRSDGTMAMRFTGAAGQRYQVFATTDLATWDLWKDFVALADTFDIIDETAATTPHRFFKVVTP
jgi:hypothetical protein